MTEERRSSQQTIVAVSTIVSILVGAFSLLSVVQSGERRTTIVEVELRTLTKQIDRMELTIKQIEEKREEEKEKREREKK